VVTAEEGKRELIPMRWGLIPRWWSKNIKDAKMATFNARAETRVVREEIFGPVVCVQSFDDDDLDAVAKFAKDTEYGLQASVWTRNLKVAHMMAKKIKAGTICVNNHNYGDPAWPFGGYKQSGWGREMGKEVMENYTETKSVAMNLG
jgi:phenylacetaldehyde dehydrogenase